MDEQTSAQNILKVFTKTLLPVEFRDVIVTKKVKIGTHFVRITFRGKALKQFTSPSFDDHVKIIFTDDKNKLVRRNYTPRSFNQVVGEVVIDFAIHSSGEASNWAKNVLLGDRATMAGPRLSVSITDDTKNQVLIGDATAIPAINRRLESLSRHINVYVFLLGEPLAEYLVDTEADMRLIIENEQASMQRAITNFMLPSKDTIVWAAGEHHFMSWLKHHFQQDKQHAKSMMRIASYWRSGTGSFHQELSEHITDN